MEKITSDVSVQDAKVLCDMGLISYEDFADFTKAKAVMVKDTISQYKHYLNEMAFQGYNEEDKSLPSNVLS